MRLSFNTCVLFVIHRNSSRAVTRTTSSLRQEISDLQQVILTMNGRFVFYPLRVAVNVLIVNRNLDTCAELFARRFAVTECQSMHLYRYSYKVVLLLLNILARIQVGIVL